MEAEIKNRKLIGRGILALINIVLMLTAVLFTVLYSRSVRDSQEQLMRDNFCSTVETMKQISVHYLSNELDGAVNWASYIQQEHMSMDEALEYIRSVSDPSSCEAHLVDMDTFEARSSSIVAGSDAVSTYRHFFESDSASPDEYVIRMQKMYAGEKYVLGRYLSRETQRNVISVGCAVMLRQPDGSDRGYLMLRVVPIDVMRKLWLFPVNYPSAEIGLIDDRGYYVVPSTSMRAENFIEFIRSYNFSDDFPGADRVLTEMKAQQSGLLKLLDSKRQDCYWYYSRLEDFEGLDILGYIPVSALSASTDTVSIVLVVAGILLLIVLVDGSYILGINRRLRSAVNTAERASRAKTQFLSSMSHDIRTPLNAVLGMTELAQSHAGDSAYVQECLRKISISGNHLLTLINDILEISRVESGRIRVNPSPFDVRELVSGLESITRSQAVGHGLRFSVVFGDLPEPWLIGDKLRLTQIYLNLLNNAVKYTEAGGSIRLEVSEEPSGSGGVVLVCVIADTGIGMSPEFQVNMYESFSRVADSRIDKIQGTGLGLAIVRRMVDLMNGTIACVSAEGEGTVFTVRIPLTASPAPLSAPHSADGGRRSTGGLAGIRVLIAEDNDLNWEIISELLRGYDICPERAENGRVCVDMLNAAPPNTYDVVLMDVQMPVLNGRDAARELRASPRDDLRDIPIIAMTADAFAEDVQMCLDAGMNAHVAKPIEIEKVLAAIRLLLSRKNTGSLHSPNFETR